MAIANKETLVAGGHLVMPIVQRLAAGRAELDPRDPYASPLAWLRPIDSEHSAIWQCLVGESMAVDRCPDPDRLGRPIPRRPRGPRRDDPAAGPPSPDLDGMGAKITIDSATLANKGLEVIEAHWLYDVGYDAIEVVIHPQSVVHSAVRFVDGSLKAQLGTPDMRLPIQYALDLPRTPALAGGRTRPRRHRSSRLPRAGRGALPGAADRP